MLETYMTSVDWAIVSFYATHPIIEIVVKASASVLALWWAYIVKKHWRTCDV